MTMDGEYSGFCTEIPKYVLRVYRRRSAAVVSWTIFTVGNLYAPGSIRNCNFSIFLFSLKLSNEAIEIVLEMEFSMN